jgi:hypothetical protein
MLEKKSKRPSISSLIYRSSTMKSSVVYSLAKIASSTAMGRFYEMFAERELGFD